MMDGWRMMGSGLPERPELLSFLVGFTLSVRALLFCADSHHICLRLTAFGSTADQGLPCWMLWPCASGEARDLPGSVLSVINILPRVYTHPQSISFNLSFVIPKTPNSKLRAQHSRLASSQMYSPQVDFLTFSAAASICSFVIKFIDFNCLLQNFIVRFCC